MNGQLEPRWMLQNANFTGEGFYSESAIKFEKLTKNVTSNVVLLKLTFPPKEENQPTFGFLFILYIY